MTGFEVMFEAGHRFAGGTVEPRPAGAVSVPSGRIVVCDPATGVPGTRPLARAVPPGRYPVTISVGTLAVVGERRVAAAMVRFSARPIARWEAAAADGDDPATLKTGQYFGYGVDAGVACFADAGTIERLTFEDWELAVVPALRAADPALLCGAAEIVVDGGDLVAFTSGAGDGLYASFWGLDADGQPVVLVTDFRIVGGEETRGRDIIRATWPHTAPAPIPAPRPAAPGAAETPRAATVRAVTAQVAAKAARPARKPAAKAKAKQAATKAKAKRPAAKAKAKAKAKRPAAKAKAKQPAAKAKAKKRR
jgi:hypothetical protein